MGSIRLYWCRSDVKVIYMSKAISPETKITFHRPNKGQQLIRRNAYLDVGEVGLQYIWAWVAAVEEHQFCLFQVVRGETFLWGTAKDRVIVFVVILDATGDWVDVKDWKLGVRKSSKRVTKWEELEKSWDWCRDCANVNRVDGHLSEFDGKALVIREAQGFKELEKSKLAGDLEDKTDATKLFTAQQSNWARLSCFILYLILVQIIQCFGLSS